MFGDDEYVDEVDDFAEESLLATFVAKCKASPWDTGAWACASLASIFLLTSSGIWWLTSTTIDGIATVTLNLGAFQQCYSVAGPPELAQSACTSGPPRNDPLYTWILACAVVNIIAGILSAFLVLLVLIRILLPLSRAAESATRERLLALSGGLVGASFATMYASSVKGAALMQYYTDAVPSNSNATVTFQLPGLVVTNFGLLFSVLSHLALRRVRGSEVDYAATGDYTAVNDVEAPTPSKRSKARPAPRRSVPQPPPRAPLQREENFNRGAIAPTFAAPSDGIPAGNPAPVSPRFMSGATARVDVGSALTLPTFASATPPQSMNAAKKGALTRRLKSVVAPTAGDVATEQDMLYLVSRVLSAIDNIAPEVSDEELLAHTLEFMREIFDDHGVGASTAVAWLNAARLKIEGGAR